MLVELAVRDLGVIAELRLDFGAGMTALTGETGAGKTMIIEALALLLGGKADPTRVRPGAEASVVEGRFTTPGDAGAEGDEIVLRRVVPAEGRSRCYVNGEMATAAGLAEIGGRLVEICGQHSHQRLLSPRAQRDALDRFGKVDLAAFVVAQSRRRDLESQLAALGGDERSRAREIDILRFQVDELDAANVSDPDEDARLAAEEDVLADAVAHLEAGAAALAELHDDGAASDRLGAALAALDHRTPYEPTASRLHGLLAELADTVGDLRDQIERIEPDPERLDAVRARRQLLVELRRKYGDTLADVMAYHREAASRLDDLMSHDARAAELEDAIAAALEFEAAAAAKVAAARRAAAPQLAEAVAERLAEVALGAASVEIGVGTEDPGDDVEFRMSANAGMSPQPIARAASGGELSRTMLALHQVLSVGAPTMIFDEVDAGVGGTAATAVGRALAGLARDTQILVVTHLPQVAAYADVQLSVSKSGDQLAVTSIRQLDSDARVIELSRMLSGSPDSETARRHAEELLDLAARDRVG
ncbi:MAG: DNA repair protein RecN [Microthrixaceae bacterium]|nr:DNA repair protein RecN [Microthrixaceae bacterium]